ncbi:MAG: hypothetical protein QNJ46_35580 [Leptolyngbyaceae cyanobacterium MO_188.B28]|nr:hypothetical protein [Leptolyngbyaceae cyanobacterium MO_188.B28]
MKTSRHLLHSLISLTLLLGVATSPALAAQTPESLSNQEPQFLKIEQPLLRIGLSLAGVGLIGILISSVSDSNHEASVDGNPM